MTMPSILHRGGLTIFAATLAACGGGGDGTGIGGGSGGGTAGIDGTGSPVVAVGTVTAFGSIVVNGVRYATTNTSFTIDGEIGGQDDLSVGDVVVVQGELDDSDNSLGTADSVVYDDAVEGPIGSIDLLAETLVVLGQTVRISSATSFDGNVPTASLAGLAAGDVIEVSGFVTSDGSIDATRLELKAGSGVFEVTGLVANHDVGTSRFEINALVVDYSMAMLEDFANGMIADGDLVEVKGGAFANPGMFVADRVEFKGDDLSIDDDDQVELEGFITRFVDAMDFDVSGVSVTTDGDTQYEGGAVGDLGLDVKVEVEGSLDAEGTLVASEVDIRRSGAVEIVARVDSVAASDSSLVVLGITVSIDSLTRFEDKSDADLEPFALADLNAGDYVEIRGLEFPAGSGEVLASLLEREETNPDPDEDTELQGFVESVAMPSFTILGVSIDANGAQFEDENEAPLSAQQFFDRLDVGDLVKASGSEVVDQAIAADEIEFEDD